MKNFIQPGKTLSLTAPAAVASGDLVMVGAIRGVASHDAASGEPVEVSVVGVYELPKDGAAIAEGELVYWDGTAVSATPTGSVLGAATEAADAGDAVAKVRLNGSFA